MMVVHQINVADTCRFEPIGDESARIDQAPVTYVAGRETSALVVKHAARLVSWYAVRVGGSASPFPRYAF
jgi:hypothetical protein